MKNFYKIFKYINSNKVFFFNLLSPLFFAGIIGIYAKALFMNKYWLAIVRLLNVETIPFQARLSYFSLDILVNFFLIPCIVIAFSFFFSKKKALIITTLISCLLIIFYFIQFRVQAEIGQYASLSLLYEAFLFTISNPALTFNYINRSAIIKLLFILSATLFSSIIVSKSYKHKWLMGTIKVGQYMVVCIVIVTLFIGLLLYPKKSSGLYKSVAHKIVNASLISTFSLSDEGMSLEKSLVEYRDLTKTPHCISSSKDILTSKKGSNILYFVMETGPSDVLCEGVSELVPKELIQNSLIAENHYATYPYTSDSIFSLLSGLYPMGRVHLVKNQHHGVIRQLSDEHYDTGAYTPSMYNAEVDEKMLQQFGFKNVFVANRNTVKTTEFLLAKENTSSLSSNVFITSPYFDQNRMNEFKTALFYDLYALEKMKADMLTSIRNGVNFANIFLPQIGHGPWFKIGYSANQKEYGRAVMKLQSLWLKDIVLMLKKEGVLSRTIIVFTSDHGVRTKAEDSSFKAGTINSYSFHIPLFIYSSGFKKPIVIKKVTSHIDIELSLSLLLGQQSGIGLTQGFPLWESSPDRRVFFFSTNYGGAEGFYDNHFFMNNIITDIQYKNTVMDFSTFDLILLKQMEKDYVLKGLNEFYSNHRNIISLLLKNDN